MKSNSDIFVHIVVESPLYLLLAIRGELYEYYIDEQTRRRFRQLLANQGSALSYLKSHAFIINKLDRERRIVKRIKDRYGEISNKE